MEFKDYIRQIFEKIMEFKDQIIQEMVDILSLDVQDTREWVCEIKFWALKCIGYLT
jgi:hypothetical protein